MKRPEQQTVFCITKLPPSTNNLYINVKKGRIRSQQYETWLQWAGIDYFRQRPERISGPVYVTMEFEQPKRRRDLDNMLKAPFDFIVSSGIIEADDWTIVRQLNAAWSDEVNGCRITVESIFNSVASQSVETLDAAGENEPLV